MYEESIFPNKSILDLDDDGYEEDDDDQMDQDQQMDGDVDDDDGGQQVVKSKRQRKKDKKDKGKYSNGNALKNSVDGGKQLSAKVINQLKDTQNLYQSNLYRFQINELLSEIQIKTKHRNKVENWLKDFKKWLVTVPQIESLSINSLKKLKRELGIRQLPLPNRFHPTKDSKLGLFNWIPPSAVQSIGSWAVNTAVSKLSSFDLAIEIPKECLNKSDYLNHKYHIKRALYLSYLGSQLLARGDIVQFCCPDGNLLRPMLEIIPTSPSSSDKESIKIRLHLIPPADLFQPKRFDIDTNNIRYDYFFKVAQREDEPVFSTPIYNQLILGDVLMLKNHEFVHNLLSSSKTNNICEAIKLLKIWLDKRHLNQGYGAFSSYIMTMFACYLLLQKKINNSMSSYQIIRVIFVNLIKSDWLVNGISLGSTSEEDMKSWFLQFDVVFLDSSGLVNFTSNMSKYTYNRIKLEAQLGLNILNSSDVSGFQAMFIKDVPFALNFDHLLEIKVTPELLAQFEAQDEYKPTILSTSDYFLPLGTTVIGQLIETCLKKRIQLIDFELPQPPVWSVSDKLLPASHNGLMKLQFGIVIDRSTAFKLLEKCESEDKAELEAFKEFWGEKSQLRRFRDGTIVESVSFESEKINNNANHICFLMVQYILRKHLKLDISEVEVEVQAGLPVGYYLDNQLEGLIEPKFQMVKAVESNKSSKLKNGTTDLVEPPKKKKKTNQGQVETEIVATSLDDITKLATSSFDGLSKILRDLDDLPLSITSVQGTSSILRYTNIYPTPPQVNYSSKLLTTRKSSEVNCLMIREASDSGSKSKGERLITKIPKYHEVIDVIVQLEGSGKWPDNIHAIQRLKCAFLLRIAQLIDQKFGLTVQAFPTHLLVLKDGFVFSIQLTYYRELILLKQLQGDDGILRLRDNLESLEQEKSSLLLPKLTSTLSSFNSQYIAFGKTCRLVKRWIATHLLLASRNQSTFTIDLKQPDYCIPEVAIELLVTSLFLNHTPFLKPPNEAQLGFLRFLTLLTTTDWNSIAIIVNFNDTLTKEEITSIESEFTKRRSTLPTPFISYPDDKLNSVWTKNVLPIIWKRLVQLARQALDLLLTHFNQNSCSTNFDPENILVDPFKTIFATDLSQFDIIIWIKNSMNCKQSMKLNSTMEAEESDSSNKLQHQFKEYVKLREEVIPIVSFDPVQSYLQELRQTFGHFGLFLYDTFGGELIAFVWKSDVVKEHEFKISTVKGQMLKMDTSSNSKVSPSPVVVPNVEGLIELFEVLGDGLVEKIELKKDFNL